ncbi:MAG: hypothetical protein JJU13_20525 [Balneolaceae bacterium]|nr:hypothetical protein [Balneolaceae bacterium]
MKSPRNPFILSGYYGRKWFCDREQELNLLREHIQNERNVVIYSWRRMGKTALIKCLLDEEKKSKIYESVYVDLLATQNLAEAIRAITKAVHHTYGKTSSGFSEALRKLFSAIGVTIRFNAQTGVPEILLNIQDEDVSERSLQAIAEFLTHRKKQVIVALDEFQQVENYQENNAEAVFRAWMQEFPEIRFIYSGSHRGMMQAMFLERNRPFYQSSQLISLEPIPESEYSRFIKKHFNEFDKVIDKSVIHQIYIWSRGQTYCIQRICNYLFSNCTEVTGEDFQRVIELLLEQDTPVFANYQKMLTNSQWNVLKAIAKEEPLYNPLQSEFIHKYRLGATSSVNTALKSLKKKELVIRDDQNGFFIHDVMLARWLQQL